MSDLLASTLRLLEHRTETFPQIARASGVGYEWLKKFSAGGIPDPGVRRVQRLHDYLLRQNSDAPTA